jgi:4-amino-4-deoxy-L-arabinose transferase-like glycosyltransferase
MDVSGRVSLATLASVSQVRRLGALLLLFGALVLASRLPLAPRQLFSFDDINLAYALDEFNPRASQPQMPGYPLFILQMRVLRALGVSRPETILLLLALAASVAALVLLTGLGNRFFGQDAGMCAAWLLLFHHSFWYGGLSSALRVQLAVASVAVAMSCYRLWKGAPGAAYLSAVVLGLGAGIRPELGLVLLPLWLVALWRSGAGLRTALRALAVLAATVLCWLVPTFVAVGGPLEYIHLGWTYLADQSSLTSVLFGAGPREWTATLVWFAVWTFSGVLLWPLTGVLAWRRPEGFGVGGERTLFLLLWFLPSFLLASLVHVADAAQTLAMVPVVCLLGGHLISRAASRLGPWLGREHAVLVLLLPAFFLNGLIFLGRLATPEGTPRGSPATWSATLWSEVLHGMDQSSLWRIRRIARVDEEAIEQARRLAAERPGSAVMIWDGGLPNWRKVAYYLPEVPLVVVTAAMVKPGAPLVAQEFLGREVRRFWHGQSPLEIDLPHRRVIWMLDPGGERLATLRRQLPLQDASPLYFCDLPAGPGEHSLGPYRLNR